MTEQPTPSVKDDPRTWYMPLGDLPDTTEDECRREDDPNQICEAKFDLDGDIRKDVVVHCTRPANHGGSHVAGDCDRIIVLWDPPAYRIQEEPV